MASGANSTVGVNFLKKFYTPQFIVNTVSGKASRLFNLITHKTNGAGKDYNFLSVVGDNPSGSATMSNSQTTGTAAMQQGAQFVVPWFNDYETPTVAGDLIAKTKNDMGGWLPALKAEMDSSLRYAGHRKSVALFTSGWGELGQIGTTTNLATTTLILADTSTVYRFIPGMQLHFSVSLNAAVLRSATVISITGVNYSTGTLTLSVTPNSLAAGIATGDIIFTAGDRQNSATPALLRPVGLGSPLGGGWAPIVQPVGGENFFGQDRSLNSFLNSFYIDGRGQPLSMSFVQAAQTCSSIGNADTLVGVCSPKQFSALANSLQGQTIYTEIKGRGGVAFKTILIYADGIELPVISDKYCVDGVAYVGDPKTFKHTSIGQAPEINNDDGNQMIRQTSDDGVEVRIRSYETFTLEGAASWATIQLA
jgi:predicted DNA-binding ribbon-helix-helix protein